MFLKKNKSQQSMPSVERVAARTRKPFLPALMVAAALTSATHAQENKAAAPFDPDAIAFSVDGKQFTNRDLATASVDFKDELQRIPVNQRREGLIEIMVNMVLLAKESEKEKLDQSEEYKRRVEQVKTRELRNLYIRKIIHPQITEELSQQRYVDLLARFKPEPEIHARHILVESEETAKALIKELDKGEDFAKLAKEKSTGPSAPDGGDLGFFGASQVVAPFQEAASKLKVGEYTKTPVKTQFGWHIIKVEGARQSEAPTYQQVLPDLQNQLFNELFAKKVTALRKSAKIEIIPDAEATASANAAQKKTE